MTSLKRGIKVRSDVAWTKYWNIAYDWLVHCQDEPAAQSITHSGLFRYYGR